jgi:hypothetical protein
VAGIAAADVGQAASARAAALDLLSHIAMGTPRRRLCFYMFFVQTGRHAGIISVSTHEFVM